jgi:hypothetical protein
MPRFLIHHNAIWASAISDPLELHAPRPRHCWPIRRRACAAGDDADLPPAPIVRTTTTGLATITAA